MLCAHLSASVGGDLDFLRTRCCLLHIGICYLNRQKIQLHVRGLAVVCRAGSFMVVLGNGTPHSDIAGLL